MTNEHGAQRRERLFERLIQPYRTSLTTRARHLTGNLADAEDLVQETLLRAYTRLDMLTSPDTVRGWLHTILLNLFINRLRRKERLPRVVALEPDRLEETCWAARRHLPITPARTPEALVEQRSAYQAAWNAVLALSIRYRQVVILADLEGLSYEEIATLLGLPIGTVRSRLSRGRLLLRRSLAAWAPDGPV